MEPKQITTSGVPSLDHLLGGGIPARQAIIVAGDPGTGEGIRVLGPLDSAEGLLTGVARPLGGPETGRP